MKCSIMITTRNRLPELLKTCEVISKLKPQPDEILITADGCTDETVETITERYPQFTLIVNEDSLGSVASRAMMMSQVKGDLVLALDDDSHPEQDDIIAKLAELFRTDEQLAVATFPQRTDEYPETLSQTDFGMERMVRSFPNSGACFRVSTYRSLPGFEPLFFHMYEEPDYALQCLANGWDVKYFPQLTIRHFWTPNQRSQLRNHHWQARNEFWSTLMRCPLGLIPAICGYRILSQLGFAMRFGGIGWVIREPIWWIKSIPAIMQVIGKRRSVSVSGYIRWLSTAS